MTPEATDHLTRQIDSASSDLRKYRPTDVDWYARVHRLVATAIPEIAAALPEVRARWEAIMNSPRRALALREKMIASQQFDDNDVQILDDLENQAAYVPTSVASKVLQKILEEHITWLGSNSDSDYPDMYDSRLDYSNLPKWTRAHAQVDNAGASLKGNAQRPVRIPDGIELKSIEMGRGIDCHYPHMGLHLIMQFTKGNWVTPWECVDFKAGFLRETDYRIGKRKSRANTVKASFSIGAQFVSLLD